MSVTKNLFVLLFSIVGTVASGQGWERYKEDSVGWTNISSEDWREGDVGRVGDIEFLVVQVVSDTEAILSVRYESQREKAKTIFWLTAPSTKGMVDRQSISVNGPVKVVGTKQYTSIGNGTNTVWHIEALHGDELAKRLEVEKQQKERADKMQQDRKTQEKIAKEKAVEDREFRTFTSADGKFKVEAKFVKMIVNPKDGTEIKLVKRDDKKEITIKSSVLSEADMKWIREKLKAEKKAKDQKALDDKLLKNGVQQYSAEWYKLGGSKEQESESEFGVYGGFNESGLEK